MSHQPILELKAELVGAQYDFYDDDLTKFLHLSAGYGFGKSTVLIHKAFKLSMLNAPLPGGLVVPSFTDFTKDILPLMEEILIKNDIKWKYHGTEHKFKFPWSEGWLYVTSCEKKIRGPNWAFAAINELTLIPIERYREVVGRVRLKCAKNPQIVSSGTPEGIGSPYYEIFVEKPLVNSRVLYGDTRENAHNLSPTYIQSLYDSYPKQLIDAYLKGLWVNMSGNRFYYSYDSKINDVANEPDLDMPFHIGIDLNVSPLCSNIWQERGEKLVCIDEVVLDGESGFQTSNLMNALLARGYTPRNSFLYPDPSSKARSTRGDPDAEVMKRFGFEVRMKGSAPRFRERQINSNNRFDKKLIEIHPTKCPKLKKDLIAVECDPVTLEKDKKNHALTHASDAMDYLIDVLRPFSSPKNKVTQTVVR